MSDSFDYIESQNSENESLPPANIIVAGITGAGKSTLINAVFGANLAATGTGRPVTEQIFEYQHDNIPIHIWDTVGLELDSAKTRETIRSIKDTIAGKANSEDNFDKIHAIWYCINSGSNRYQGAELEFIRSLHSIGVPFIIVLTQCTRAQEDVDKLETKIREINSSMDMDDIDIIQVCAQGYNSRIGYLEPFGLDDLVRTTVDRIPDFVKGGFIAAQNVAKAQKREYCGEIIIKYIDAAEAGFFNKIPIANIFDTDHRIHKMFIEIGQIYQSIITPDEVKRAIKQLGGLDLKRAIFGIILPPVLPVSWKFDRKVDSLFAGKKDYGLNIPMEKLSKEKRVARMLAYTGYLFMDSLEELWEEWIDAEMKKIDNIVDKLTEKVRTRFYDASSKRGENIEQVF